MIDDRRSLKEEKERLIGRSIYMLQSRESLRMRGEVQRWNGNERKES